MFTVRMTVGHLSRRTSTYCWKKWCEQWTTFKSRGKDNNFKTASENSIFLFSLAWEGDLYNQSETPLRTNKRTADGPRGFLILVALAGMRQWSMTGVVDLAERTEKSIKRACQEGEWKFTLMSERLNGYFVVAPSQICLGVIGKAVGGILVQRYLIRRVCTWAVRRREEPGTYLVSLIEPQWFQFKIIFKKIFMV